MGLPPIDPPLLNSANPWCTTLEDLQNLYDCPYTGAITTRTSLIHGFEHDPRIHQHVFFDPSDHDNTSPSTNDYSVSPTHNASFNTLGYSSRPLSEYLSFVRSLTPPPHNASTPKPIIISVTGTPTDIYTSYTLIHDLATSLPPTKPLCMEINLSCPNIASKPPPAYDSASLLTYLTALHSHRSFAAADRLVKVGIKVPPYTYHGQFVQLVDTILAAAKQATTSNANAADINPIDFITSTNTLGSSLLLDAHGKPVLDSASGGLGGMAGAALHPLTLGNVKSIRQLLDASPLRGQIDIIGVGGVEDRAGFERMRAVGATVVGVGTALGREGVAVFEKIWEGGDGA